VLIFSTGRNVKINFGPDKAVWEKAVWNKFNGV
jgi:hypothetical protein